MIIKAMLQCRRPHPTRKSYKKARSVLDLSGSSEIARLGAARSILELSNKLRETVELEGRLKELENRLLMTGENI
jgi:hypothetical protein